MKPYESDASRVRTMYRLLAPRNGGRTLELCFGAPPMLDAPDWRGEHVGWTLQAPTRGADARTRRSQAQWRWQMPSEAGFDLVVLHRTLDRLAGACDSAALEALFRALAECLVPGGIVVATGANGAWLSRLRRARRAGERGATDDGDGRLSWRRLRRLYAAGGFVQMQSYNVLAAADAPLRLVSTDADLSRLGFRRELAFMQSSLPLAPYLLRRVVAELALNRHFENWLLTLGTRP